MNEKLWETEKAFFRICLFAKACGVQIARGAELEIDSSYIGKTFEADVRMGEPNDKGDSYPEIAKFGDGPNASLFLADGAPTPAPAPKAEAPKAGGMW